MTAAPLTDSAPDDGLDLDDFFAHDPFVLAHAADRQYYLYTAGEGGVVVYTSTDLRRWHGPRLVFRVPSGSWADPAQRPWAPEVHEHGGRYYLFTTLHNPAVELGGVAQGGTRIAITSYDGKWNFHPSARGTVTAVADSPLGPFELLDPTAPVPPSDFMTLDGTLFIDDDEQPWMVYAHEWVQVLDGTIEAIRLTADLSRSVGDPIHLFRGSEASWLGALTPSTHALAPYVTDGPQLRRLASGALLMLWASYRRDGAAAEYVETSAVSRSGRLEGPWEQHEILVDGNAGHGMVFDTFEGTPMLVLHRGMNTPRVRAELHQLVEEEDRYRLA